VHEVWEPLDVVAQALAPLLPGRVRMVPHPLALCLLPQAEALTGLALADPVVVALMVVSLVVYLIRKDPLAGIAALWKAFRDRLDQIISH
jgi:hypothetical protein